MAETVVKTAKTVEQALKSALDELGVSEDRVTYEILDRPSKGLFGILGGKPARVRVTLKETSVEEPVAEEKEIVSEVHDEHVESEEPQKVLESSLVADDTSQEGNLHESDEKPFEPNPEVLQRAERFLADVFRTMGMEVGVRSEATADGYLIHLEGKSLGVLIGKHGQTLDALQYLTNLAANQERTEQRVRIIIDVEGYRARRTETLQKLANRLADRAVRIHQEIKLEPMNRHERKIIHMALQDNQRVTTHSAGEEPYRYIIIVPGKGKRK